MAMNDKSNLPPSHQKVHAMANLFQRKATEEEKDSKETVGTTVIRTESHAARFNNARALFERLGEGRINTRSTQFSIKHSTSKDDNLKDPSPEREHQRSPSPKKSKFVGISNGVNKIESGVGGMIQNVSRKSDKPEKPEKPERKFNSKELIEKQKNWTSHFTKSRSAASARCADIIRTVPGTGVINDINKTPEKSTRSPSIDSPPSPLQRSSTSSNSTPPEVKPRTSSRSGSITSPQKLPDVINSTTENDNSITYAVPRKKSLDFHDQQHSSNNHSPLPPTSSAIDNRRHSSDKDSSLTSPAHPATPSPVASSSGPSSPIHTEDEKQENESNEKTESNAPKKFIEDNDNDENDAQTIETDDSDFLEGKKMCEN